LVRRAEAPGRAEDVSLLAAAEPPVVGVLFAVPEVLVAAVRAAVLRAARRVVEPPRESRAGAGEAAPRAASAALRAALPSAFSSCCTCFASPSIRLVSLSTSACRAVRRTSSWMRLTLLWIVF